MKLTKTQLKEMIRAVITEQLKQVGPTWGSGDPTSGLGGFVGKVGTKGIEAAREKAIKAKAEKKRLAAQSANQDKTVPGGRGTQAQRQSLQRAQAIEQLHTKAIAAVDNISTDQAKLEALLQFLQN